MASNCLNLDPVTQGSEVANFFAVHPGELLTLYVDRPTGVSGGDHFGNGDYNSVYFKVVMVQDDLVMCKIVKGVLLNAEVVC